MRLMNVSRAFRATLWWIVAGTEGGKTRAKIVLRLKERPMNANQLADYLKMDYKTIRYHLKLLKDNKLVESTGGDYGSMYFLTSKLESNFHVLQEIWEKIQKENDNTTTDVKGGGV